MLKRQDLAKQFELVVKQEIINHNQQISQSPVFSKAKNRCRARLNKN